MTTRRRARTTGGQFAEDDPSTPDVDEAWESASTPAPDPEPEPEPEPENTGGLQPGDLRAFTEAVSALSDERLGEALLFAHGAVERFVGRKLPSVLSGKLGEAVLVTAAHVAQGRPLAKGDLPQVAKYHVMRRG